jgi:hypothetical protein
MQDGKGKNKAGVEKTATIKVHEVFDFVGSLINKITATETTVAVKVAVAI